MRQMKRKIVSLLMVMTLMAAVLSTPSGKTARAEVVGINPVEVHVGLSTENKYTTMTRTPIVLVAQDASVIAVSAGATSIVTGGACQIIYEYTGLKVGKTTLSVYQDGVLKGTVGATVTDHVWAAEPTIDEKPTCTSEGVQSIHCTCEGCEAIKPDSVQPVPKSPHTWRDVFTVDRQPTYFKEGQESKHCTVCNAIDKNSITLIPKQKLGRAKIKSVKNDKAKTTFVTMKMMKGPDRFDFAYGKKEDFSNAKTIQTRNTHVKLVNLRVGKTYYFRARAVLKKNGKTVKGKWSKTKSIMIKR